MDDDEIQDILLGIHSRLGQIDGKTTLNVRANSDKLIELVREVVEGTPLVGQIYLVVDGRLTQSEVGETLGSFGLEPGAMALSRAFDKAFGTGLLARNPTPKGKKGKVWARDPAMESALRLSKQIPAWLKSSGEVVPVGPKRKRRKAAPKQKGATSSSRAKGRAAR